VATFVDLFAAFPWQPIRGCPGRFLLPGGPRTLPLAELAPGTVATSHRVAGARDPVWVAAFADGGGVISYGHADGRFLHTLNTPAGFARKLGALGIVPPQRVGDPPPTGAAPTATTARG
jgi:hypothetical protein